MRRISALAAARPASVQAEHRAIWLGVPPVRCFSAASSSSSSSSASSSSTPSRPHIYGDVSGARIGLPKKIEKVRRTFAEAGAEAIAREEARKAGKPLPPRAKRILPQDPNKGETVRVLPAPYIPDSLRQSYAEQLEQRFPLPKPEDDPVSSAATGASPSAGAAAAATPSGPLSLASEVVWLYRTILRHARALEDAPRREAAKSEAQERFRAVRSTDEATVRKAIATGYSKLSFLRMATPKLAHPRMGRIPPYPGALALFGGQGEAAHLYMYAHGEIVPTEERERMMASAAGSGRTVVNSQGITDEHRKKHHALVERMNFRGPYWAGKPKY